MICAESNHQRISFASDLDQSNKGLPKEQPSGLVRRDTTLLDSSNSDFEFDISRNFDPEDSSPADEIFAHGMILPVLPLHVAAASSIPKRLYKYELPPIVSTPSLSSFSLPPLPLPLPLPVHSRKYSLNGRRSGAKSESEAEKSSKSFWSFKRSSTLNGDVKKSLICSLRRNSTGSLTNSKRTMLKDMNKHSSHRRGVPCPRENLSSHMLAPSSSCSFCCSSYQFRPQKQVRKNGGGGRGGSFWIAPVIGGPSPFWLGSILRLSKKKK